ncbi:MAG: hypothetical protein Q4G34_02330 [Micrococcus sp.]|nr:hypothetical protein [Micrococcus sp.]
MTHHPLPGTPQTPDDGAPTDALATYQDEMVPLIGLAVEHGLDLLSQGENLLPTILAVTDDGQQGMWTLPDLNPEDVASHVAQIEPRPAKAVAVFDGLVGTDDPDVMQPTFFVESFQADDDVSIRMIFPHDLGDPESGLEPRILEDPTVVANGINPLGGPLGNAYTFTV